MNSNNLFILKRIIGFDLARAYAILVMFIVNFVNVFGGYGDFSILGRFAALFNGNASSLFVILAGIGTTLATSHGEWTAERKKQWQKTVSKRSWFLFGLGLLLYNWWPFDILHFYGAYLHIAAFILFLDKRYYLYLIGFVIFIYYLLFWLIPYQTGWDFANFIYLDFWTIKGFIRNSLYNGSNPFFPWFAFFLLGMWLGRLELKVFLSKKFFLIVLFLFLAVELLQILATLAFFPPSWSDYILADYFPPFLPFMLSTASAALLVIYFCLWIGQKYSFGILSHLAQFGQMTLTNYLLHLTLGMVLLAVLLDKNYAQNLTQQLPSPTIYTLLFALGFYLFAFVLSIFWFKKFKYGPIETIMRKICG